MHTPHIQTHPNLLTIPVDVSAAVGVVIVVGSGGGVVIIVVVMSVLFVVITIIGMVIPNKIKMLTILPTMMYFLFRELARLKEEIL